MTTLVTVPFNNQSVIASIVNDHPHVAMKPICENIGIDWEGQRQKILRHPVLSKAACMIKAPTKGGIQEMLMLPLNMLNGWLFLIDANRVKPEVKDSVIKYQKECFDVLADHFLPKPRNTITPEQKAVIQNAVIAINNDQGIHYATTYRSIKKKFNVNSYHELTREQYPAVCEFLGIQQDIDAIEQDTVINTQHAIKKLHDAGFIVIEKSEHGVKKFVLDYLPYKLLPVLIDVAWSRLRSIHFIGVNE